MQVRPGYGRPWLGRWPNFCRGRAQRRLRPLLRGKSRRAPGGSAGRGRVGDPLSFGHLSAPDAKKQGRQRRQPRLFGWDQTRTVQKSNPLSIS